LWLQWVFFDYPSIDKEFKRIKLYMLDSTSFVPFSIRIRTYRNFNTSVVDSDITLTFSTASDFEKLATLKLNKARGISYRMTVSALHQSPILTGWEHTVAGLQDKDNFSRQLIFFNFPQLGDPLETIRSWALGLSSMVKSFGIGWKDFAPEVRIATGSTVSITRIEYARIIKIPLFNIVFF
jgi:hypothetical protein